MVKVVSLLSPCQEEPQKQLRISEKRQGLLKLTALHLLFARLWKWRIDCSIIPTKEEDRCNYDISVLEKHQNSLRKNLVYFLYDFPRESALTLALNFVAANRNPCS